MLGQSAQHLDPRLHHQLAAAMSHHQTLQGRTKEDLLLLGLDEYKNSTSPSISSPESHNSDTSVEVSETRLLAGGGLFLNNTKCSPEQRPGSNPKDTFMPLPFASLASLGPSFPHPAAFFTNPTASSHHSGFLFPSSTFFYHHHQQPKFYPSVLKNNNNRYAHNNNNSNNNNNGDLYSKRYILDAILRSQQSPSGGSTSRDDEEEADEEDENGVLAEETTLPKHQSPVPYSTNKRTVLTMSRLTTSPHQDDPEQENPMDLSMKGCLEENRISSPVGSVDDEVTDQEDEDSQDVPVKNTEHDMEYDSVASDHTQRHSLSVVAPMDLTTRA
jgi:nuclear receptor subfamily 0 group A